MSTYMRAEFRLFLEAVGTGAFFLLFYDLLRVLKRGIPQHTILNGCMEILFWIGSAVVIFVLVDLENQGIVRFFVFFGIYTGIWFNKKTIHPYVLHFWNWLFQNSAKVAKKVRKILLFSGKRCKIFLYKFAKLGKVGENRFCRMKGSHKSEKYREG